MPKAIEKEGPGIKQKKHAGFSLCLLYVCLSPLSPCIDRLLEWGFFHGRPQDFFSEVGKSEIGFVFWPVELVGHSFHCSWYRDCWQGQSGKLHQNVGYMVAGTVFSSSCQRQAPWARLLR